METEQATTDPMKQFFVDESARQEGIGDFVLANNLGIKDMPENPYDETDGEAIEGDEGSTIDKDLPNDEVALDDEEISDETEESDPEIEGDAEAEETNKQKAAKDKQDKAKASMLGQADTEAAMRLTRKSHPHRKH